jgi:hypothetical protein
MANRYWVGGSGTWDSTTTTNWSASSGGSGGASAPTSVDDVFFDSSSGAAPTVTIGTNAACGAMTAAAPTSGTLTFAFGSTGRITFNGNWTNPATNFARTGSGNATSAVIYAGSGSSTLTTNGVNFATLAWTVNAPGGTLTLGSAFTATGTLGFIVTAGTFSTSASNYALSVRSIVSNNSNTRAISLNGSAVALTSSVNFLNSTGLTFNAGTSTITGSSLFTTFNGGGQTFYNASFTWNTLTLEFTGANTFNNLTIPGDTSTPAINLVTFGANQTINGTLTLGAGTAASYRTFLASDTIGTTRTLTVNSFAAGAAEIDFRDIAIAGAAAPISGTRFGDCKGNSGITFPAAKTVYYRSTGNSSWYTSWSATSGGASDATQFPLAQDTAVFPAATYPASGSQTSISINYNIGTIDMSARTSNTMTLATGTTTPTIYGDWINGTGIALTGTGIITFAGRGSQTITSASVTFTQPITINTLGGTVSCADALTLSSTNALTFVLGTLKLKSSATNTVGSFVTSGTTLKYLESTTAGTQATLSDASGTNTVTYLSIRDSAATGGAIFDATSGTNGNAGNNTGWSFGAGSTVNFFMLF